MFNISFNVNDSELFIDGEWVDVSQIPEFLGDDLPSRLDKWLEYKKNGVMLIK